MKDTSAVLQIHLLAAELLGAKSIHNWLIRNCAYKKNFLKDYIGPSETKSRRTIDTSSLRNAIRYERLQANLSIFWHTNIGHTLKCAAAAKRTNSHVVTKLKQAGTGRISHISEDTRHKGLHNIQFNISGLATKQENRRRDRGSARSVPRPGERDVDWRPRFLILTSTVESLFFSDIVCIYEAILDFN